MKYPIIICGAVALLVLISCLLIKVQSSEDAFFPFPPHDIVACTMEAMQCPDGSFVGRTGPHCDFVCPPLPAVDATVTAAIAALADEVVITAPVPQAVITSPLLVTGKARGGWFFEGTFPVTVETAAGTVVGAGLARATGNTMTSDFVPFTATLSWSASPSLAGGVLRVRRDNPSGLPKNDRYVAIPVRFIPSTSSQGL
jgi:Immunoglobulin-like domain of bacterial spore germination